MYKLRRFGFFAILIVSLAINYATYRSRKNIHINGSGDPSFYQYGNTNTVSVDGCVLWQDEKLRSDEVRQYWKIKASDDGSSCNLIELLQLGDSVLVSGLDECTLLNINSKERTATLSYKDATITINGDRTIWSTKDPSEKGGGEIVKCTDRRLNWYLF